MSSFIYDALTLPDGKIDGRPRKSPGNQYVNNDEWNSVMSALYDTRTALLDLNQSSQTARVTGVNSGDVSIGTANGLSLASQAISLAVAVNGGANGALLGSDKTKLDNLSGSNSGDVSIGTANGLSLASQAISLSAAGAATTGAITSGAQTIGGAKTFAADTTFSTGKRLSGIADGASAIAHLFDGPAYSTAGAKIASFQHGASEKAFVDKDGSVGGTLFYDPAAGAAVGLSWFGGAAYFGTATVRTNGLGYWIGGVNASFTSSGLQFVSGVIAQVLSSLAAPLMFATTTQGGSSGDQCLVSGTNVAAPHARSIVSAVGQNVSLGNANLAQSDTFTRVMGDGRSIQRVPNSAPTDADLMSGSLSFYLDETNDLIKGRVRLSGGGGYEDFSHPVQMTHVRAETTSGASMTGNASTTIVYDTEVNDTNSEYDPTTGIFAAAKTGYYNVTASAILVAHTFAATQSANAQLVVFKNGSTFVGLGSFYQLMDLAGTNSYSGGSMFSSVLHLTAGDTLKVQMSQNNGPGTALALATTHGGSYNFFTVDRLA